MIEIGNVTAVVGTEITIKANANSNLETHFYQGAVFKGVSIREFIAVDHGVREIVCLVEGEYLDDRLREGEGPEQHYVRKLKVRPVGYFEDGKFADGIKFLPKIGDVAKLIPAKMVEKIFEPKDGSDFSIGKLLKEELRVNLPWKDLFNTHIGIFGNTGSGKSNTLAKLLTTLFEQKAPKMVGKSRFVVIDFNGEYTGGQICGEDYKSVTRLSTRQKHSDRFSLSDNEFWDPETLGILFQATANTQKPFLRRIISGRQRFADVPNSLKRFFRATLERVLKSKDPSLEALEQVKYIARLLNADDLTRALDEVGLRSGSNVDSFHVPDANKNWRFLSQESYEEFVKQHFLDKVEALDLETVSGIGELQLRANLQIVRDALSGAVQYEHIQPLLRRIEALKGDLEKVLLVGDESHTQIKPLHVVSLREVRQDIKKILPIPIAKQLYEQHKSLVGSPPRSTVHLIVDEAHNILSTQSSRETESWKDYRLELFEEVIKEGRKFGIFIMLSSQRPSDISATIVSQVHNFFIHRLINDRDLALLDNAISTLDTVSKSQIPSLPKGACVVTGTIFDVPMLLQVDRLSVDHEPDSRDVDLGKIWGDDDTKD